MGLKASVGKLVLMIDGIEDVAFLTAGADRALAKMGPDGRTDRLRRLLASKSLASPLRSAFLHPVFQLVFCTPPDIHIIEDAAIFDRVADIEANHFPCARLSSFSREDVIDRPCPIGL